MALAELDRDERKVSRPDPKASKLEKQLGLWDVYALATGATLSSGVFLLPGLAAAGAGAALSLSYVLGALILLPGLLAHVELATAMPRAGGIYYFLDRSLGPFVGTIGGFGTWIALILKTSFALIGIGAYLRLFFPDLQIGPIAALLAISFGVINYVGTKKSGAFQKWLLLGLAMLLSWFCGFGILQTEISHYTDFFAAGSSGIVSTAGLVIVSYMGLTKVVGVAEEVKNPERNLPLGMLLAFGTVVATFVLATSVMVGVVGVEPLARGGGDLTPVATVADRLAGRWGSIVMTVAAVMAFASAANAGVLSASRYPLAMGRDRLLPSVFSRIGQRGTPTVGLAVTVGLIVLSVTLFDPTKIAKLASAFKLVVFALACLAVIVMRESRIGAYDPSYRSPFYPAVQIVGILAPLWLIIKMGLLATMFTAGLILLGAMWYTYYAHARVDRAGAIHHVFERLGNQRSNQQKHDRSPKAEWDPDTGDPFMDLQARAHVLDVTGPIDFADLADRASRRLATDLPVSASQLTEGFLNSMPIGTAPVFHGAALPHQQLDIVARPSLVLARATQGVRFSAELGVPSSEEPIRALFFLVGPKREAAIHLHNLARIAARLDQEGFMSAWLGAHGEEELKEVLFGGGDPIVVITLLRTDESRAWIDHRVNQIWLPDGTLIATIRRGQELIIPTGETELREGDQLTLIGGPRAIGSLRDPTNRPFRIHAE